MIHPLRSALAAVTAFLLVGCLAPRPAVPGSQDGSRGEDGSEDPEGALVMSREALDRYGGRLMDAMEAEFTSLRVVYEPSATLCPLVSLRGSIVSTTYSNPLVFVDGNRMTNTCVLDELDTGDVERVELYPSGRTSRPGYSNHPSGLILVFTRER